MFFPWLIKTDTYEIKKDVVPKSYAILSHRWDEDEVKFNTMQPGDLQKSKKLKGACDIAKANDEDYIWIDSVCMDKSNAVETSTNINSMFDYYQNAEMCLTYLGDVDTTKHSFPRFKTWKDRSKNAAWFYRGWTLQELLASPTMWFYDTNWELIGTKDEEGVLKELKAATNIDPSFLDGDTTFRAASVATRMSWMAGRTTTRVEDIAYSMLGIFDISMDIQYGEGVKAFLRLQRLLLEGPRDESIFAWTTNKALQCYSSSSKWAPQSWGLLAPSPDCFSGSGRVIIPPSDQVEQREYGWAQNGMKFMVPQKSGTDVTNWLGLPKKDIKFALNCWVHHGDSKPTVVLHLKSRDGINYVRVDCESLNETRGARPSSNRVLGIEQIIRRPLNVGQPPFTLSGRGQPSEANPHVNTGAGASRLRSTNMALLDEFQTYQRGA